MWVQRPAYLALSHLSCQQQLTTAVYSVRAALSLRRCYLHVWHYPIPTHTLLNGNAVGSQAVLGVQRGRTPVCHDPGPTVLRLRG